MVPRAGSGVWSEVGPHPKLGVGEKQDLSGGRSLSSWHPQSDGGKRAPPLRSLQADGGHTLHEFSV